MPSADCTVAKSGDTLTNFPPSFSYDGLSVLLGRSVAGLQADKCRKPWTLPPACKIPGAKSPVWLLTDVLDWLASHREPVAEPPAGVVVTHPPRRGRPTKAEAARRRAAAAAEKGGQQ